jgi:uncharacterized membrane protein YfcA
VVSGGDLRTVAALAAVTFLFGLLIGFVGAGGAGLAVALLTSVYHLPVHQAIGTALAAMCFVTVAGSLSHYREGNVAPRLGLVVGVAGASGAVLGADTSQLVPAATLRIGAGLALWLLAGLVWLRTRLGVGVTVGDGEWEWAGERSRPAREWASAIGLGVSGGAAAAFFGVGMAPFLQLGFLTVLRLPLRQTVGTTMLTLIFISGAGALALARHGDVSPPHLIGTTLGLGGGAFLGARFTRRAPRRMLRGAVVAIPAVAGGMLLFG